MLDSSVDKDKEARIGQVQTNVVRDEEDGLQMGPLAGKWHGTTADRRDMSNLGRAQELRRNFRFISLMSFACTLISTWEFILTTLSISLIDGGTAGLVWGFIAIVPGFLLVYASIAEMASMAPTSGGQYHWVSEFAPPRCQKYLSYITGWLCFTGWQTAVLAAAFLAGTIIQGLLVLNEPSYVYERWHGTLLAVALSVFSILFNTFLAKKLPLVEGLLLVLHILGLFAIIVPLWVLAPRNSAKAVFTEFSNGGGWANTGTSVMIGLLTPIVSMAGFDCAVHMSEEVKDAGETLPKAMMWSVALSSVLGLVMVLTLCFTLGDVTSILASTTRYPFIQIIFNATNSLAGTNLMVTVVILALVACCISQVATASRQLWSFARDKGVPFSSTIAHVTPGWNIPLNAVIVSLFVAIALSMINIGSSIALNAILSLCAVSVLSSYLISIGCVLLKRIRGEPLPARRWSLGRYGFVINVGSMCFLLPIFVFCFFPSATPVVASTMNWNIAIYGGMLVFATGYYVVVGRFHYVPPVLLVKREL